MANSAPPRMTGGSRHSGTGMPPLAVSFLMYRLLSKNNEARNKEDAHDHAEER